MIRNTTVAAVATALLALPASAATVTSLVGDKDCFGTNGACVESPTDWLPGGWGAVVQEPGDPGFTDVVLSGGGTTGWTHAFAAGSYTSATLSILTAGIADIYGPYAVFADGVKVGEMPLDGFGHIIVETFTFALDPAAASDGLLDISFQSVAGDSWAIDHSEVTLESATVVPLPASGLLLGGVVVALGAASRRRRAR